MCGDMSYSLLHIIDSCSLIVFSIHIVNQATVLWQEMQVAKEVPAHIPHEIVNVNILPFLTMEYQLPECYRFGCTNRACGKVKSGGWSGLSHLRCGESGCEDICAWNNGNDRCTTARAVGIFCASQHCKTLWTLTRATFIAEREDREAAGEKF